MNFGKWTFNPANGCIEAVVNPTSPFRYQIALDRLRSAQDLNSWLQHMKPKNWVSDKDLAELEEMFIAIYGPAAFEPGIDLITIATELMSRANGVPLRLSGDRWVGVDVEAVAPVP